MDHSRRDDDAMAAAERSDAGRTHELRVSYLTAVRELNHFRFGPRRTDVRRWPVFSAEGRLAGTVDRLLVETATRKVRYAVVALDHHAASDERPNQSGGVLVPIGALRRGDGGVLTLSELTAQMLVDAPRLPARPITRADELATLAVYGCDDGTAMSSELYTHPRFDETEALAP